MSRPRPRPETSAKRLFYVERGDAATVACAPAGGERVTNSRALVARNQSENDTAVLLPLDWVRWTAATDRALRLIATVRGELKATRLQMVLTGLTSPRAGREIAAQGWTIVAPPVIEAKPSVP